VRTTESRPIVKALLTAALASAALVMTVPETKAQFLGHNFAGDFGVNSGSQPPPGFYLAPAYVRASSDKLVDQDGNILTLNPDQRSELDVNAYAVAAWWVTNKKIFGGNYGLQVVPAFTDNKLEAPVLGQTNKTSVGFADLYFQPINLGWHTDRADYLAAIGVYAPTGNYDVDADDNRGMGMWTLELIAGTTLYLDKAKTWSFAATGALEFHSEKQDTDIRVGPILTVEGGVGKAFMDGAVNVGVAYYAQWKLGSDSGTGVDEIFETLNLNKHRGFGIGPDITLPIATKSKLYGFVNVRYFWEFGVRSNMEAQNLVVTVTLPIPSVNLQ
jgi:hypothetical protein